MVTTEDGLELILADGPRDEATADAWGCDRADDGAREIVQATVRHEGPTAHRQRQAFRLAGAAAARAGTTRGTMAAEGEPQTQAASQVDGCRRADQ